MPHSDRAPVSAPQTAPLLHVACTTPLCQSVGFRDGSALARRAKPPGVTAMLLVAAVVDGAGGEDTAPTDPDALPVRGIATRQSIGVTFTSADRAKTACYFGRWITGTGLLGPWSQMASMVIAAWQFFKNQDQPPNLPKSRTTNHPPSTHHPPYTKETLTPQTTPTPNHPPHQPNNTTPTHQP